MVQLGRQRRARKGSSTLTLKTFTAAIGEMVRSASRDAGSWVRAMITARNVTKAAFSLSSPYAVLLVKPSKRLCWQSTSVFSVTDRRVLVVTWTEENLGQD